MEGLSPARRARGWGPDQSSRGQSGGVAGGRPLRCTPETAHAAAGRSGHGIRVLPRADSPV